MIYALMALLGTIAGGLVTIAAERWLTRRRESRERAQAYSPLYNANKPYVGHREYRSWRDTHQPRD